MVGTPFLNLIQVIISFVAAILSLSSAIFLIFKGKKGELRTLGILISVNQFIGSSAYILEYAVYLNINWFVQHDLVSVLLRCNNFYKYIGLCTIGALSLIFWLQYCFKTLNALEQKLLRNQWILFIPGILLYALLPTTDQHRLVYYALLKNGSWTVYLGLAHYIFGYIGFLYYLLGAKVLLKHIVRSYPYSKKRSLIFAASGFFTMLINFIYYFGTDLYQKTKNFNIDSFLILVSLSAFYLAVLKYRFLSITPIAFPKMVDELKESILIIDADGSIAYFNRAFQENFSDCPSLTVDSEVTLFTGYLKNSTPLNLEQTEIIQCIETVKPVKISGEIKLAQTGKHFTIDIQPFFNKKDYIGQIITLYDITDYQNLLREINSQNTELETANAQLQEYAATVEELAIARERNRLAGEVHDSVGHTMTVLISLIGVCSLACDKDIGTLKQKLDEMMNVALKGHQELRRSVQGILPCTHVDLGIIPSIHSLARDYEKTGVTVDFSVDGDENPAASIHRGILYRISQEALTNSLHHGEATQVTIILRFLQQKISLFIFDDGIGCKEIKKHIGLQNMENRVLAAGGKISFGSDGEKGFNIHVELPIPT